MDRFRGLSDARGDSGGDDTNPSGPRLAPRMAGLEHSDTLQRCDKRCQPALQGFVPSGTNSLNMTATHEGSAHEIDTELHWALWASAPEGAASEAEHSSASVMPIRRNARVSLGRIPVPRMISTATRRAPSAWPLPFGVPGRSDNAPAIHRPSQ